MERNAAEETGARTVGEVVAEDYRRASVFQRFGIDFCCGGGRTVRAACAEGDVAYADLENALAALERSGDRGDPEPHAWELDVLARHIVDVHHRYVREATPSLLQFSEKVVRVHGARHEELREIRALVAELMFELGRHMAEEEGVLFPRIERILAARAARALQVDEPDSVSAPLGGLEDDHEHAGGLMRRIRELSGGYSPPADACTTYRALYAKLEEFESDLHRHVHLENNVLFPGARALAMESARVRAVEA